MHAIHMRNQVPPELLSLPLDRLLTEHLDGVEGDALDSRLWFRFLFDLEAFCLAMFPERFPTPFNRYHKDVFAEVKVPCDERWDPLYQATAAPRGTAKTTLRTFADLVHDVVYGFERFIGVISTSFDLSETLVADLYDVFRSPDAYPELHRMYGPFKVDGTKTGFVVTTPSSQQPMGTKIKAYSMGGACRGHKHRGIRFTKWVLDDAERSDRVHNPVQRDKDEHFIDADVVAAGAHYTIVQFVGTILHEDSVLARKLNPHKSPRWERQFYQAILTWPDEIDGLWERCREIWADLSRSTARAREEAARAFYAEHRIAMDAGAQVLWPEREGLFELMVQWWTNRHAFAAEKQNEPGKSGERTFDVDRIIGRQVTVDGPATTGGAIVVEGERISLAACKIAVWWDPIPYNAKQTGRDKAGFAVAAKAPNGGKFVLEARVGRMSPERQWEEFFGYVDRFPTATYGYENNTGDPAAQEEWARRVREIRRTHRRFSPQGYQTRQAAKKNRIADIQPACENGFIRFNVRGVQPEVLEQFRHFPDHNHDDGPDAVERALWLLDQEISTVTRRGY